MSKPLTAEEAIEQLRKNLGEYATPETLRSLAAQVDADATGRLTVLYSGPAANGVWSTQVIDAMVEAGEDVRVINKSEAAKFLTSDDFYHALAQAYDIPARALIDGSYRGPATAWLYHPENGPWADASGRFADATKGEVVAIVGDADPGRVFGKVEVPHILANPNVTRIEGIPRETLAAMSKPGDTQAAFEMIVARAREHDGRLRVAVPDAINYRGQLLYDASSRLRVDSRGYFEGTSIEGKAPALHGETRALSENMNPPTKHALAGQARIEEAWQQEMLRAQGAGEIPESSRLDPHLRGLNLGLAAEAAITAHEWNETRQRAQVFRDTLRNDTAAMDAYVQQGAQTGGVLVGSAAGGVTAATLGMGTGGTALLVAGEGYLFGKAAERGVELWQQHDIRNITSEGVDWAFNGRQWIREDLRADMVNDARDLPRQQNFAALPDKARELSSMASVVAVERALGQVPTPRDPFVQPAGDGGEPWRYHAERGAWAREVVTAYDVNNQPSARETVEAKGDEAAQLSADAMRIIDRNLAAGPAEIAARYQQGHKAHGYDQTPSGAMPDAVTTALNPDLLQASDGRHYRCDAQGTWTHEGKTADPTRALELELTRDRLLPALENHRQQLDHMPTWQPPTPEMQDKAMLREAYRDHGIDRETRQEYFDASYLAVQRTRADTGVTAATTSLVLGQDVSGRFTPDSPIHHLRMDADGAVRIAAITTPEDIARALTDVRTRERSEHIAPTEDAAIRVRAPIEQAEPAAREQRAPLINAPTHPDARMYQSILHHVQTEDRRRGREPDDISERLAAGLTVDAKARGLQTVGFFRMSDDGTRAFMADTPDPSTPWARTAASDIAAAVRQDLQASSEKVADINLQQGMHAAQQQGIQAQEAARPRMA